MVEDQCKESGGTHTGRQYATGLAAIEAARADGRWNAAYKGHRTMSTSEDFPAALEANPKANLSKKILILSQLPSQT